MSSQVFQCRRHIVASRQFEPYLIKAAANPRLVVRRRRAPGRSASAGACFDLIGFWKASFLGAPDSFLLDTY